MGMFHAGVPGWLLRWVASETSIRRSVETGTFRGDTTMALADAIGQCTSIEIEHGHAGRASARFAQRPDITILEGDSRSLLSSLSEPNQSPAFYWLDGHWSGEGTGGADSPCALLAEIDIICRHNGIADNVVAIDDARLFGMPHSLDPTMLHFPRLSTVLRRLDEHGAQSFVVDDVIVAVPASLAASFMTLHSLSEIRQNTAFYTIWPSIKRAQVRAIR